MTRTDSAVALPRRDYILICGLALIIGGIMAALVQHPGYTDAYYYFNAAKRLAQGQGLTDIAVWTYLGAPAKLPIPSHLYWMPLTSLVATLGTVIQPTFDAAQIPFVGCYALLVGIAFWLGGRLGKTRRAAWLAGLLMLFSGYYFPYWITTATFSVYGVVGVVALITIGLVRQTGRYRYYVMAGVAIGLAHLTRADGILLLLVLLLVCGLGSLRSPHHWRRDLTGLLLAISCYLLTMSPWFLRNLSVIGSPLPAGGLQTAWMRSYDEIVNYPPTIDLAAFFSGGLLPILRSRWEAFVVNGQTFVAVEGLILFAPFMLVALWKRRRDPLLVGMFWYALGLHIVMTIVFALPGYRGGLFHSSAALMPFWAALGICGLNDGIGWLAKRRRWRVQQAQQFFGVAALAWAVLLSVLVGRNKIAEWNSAGEFFRGLGTYKNDVVMVNDPAAYSYFTGGAAVVLPNAPVERLPDIFARYHVRYVIIDSNYTPPLADLWFRRNVPYYLKYLVGQKSYRVYENLFE